MRIIVPILFCYNVLIYLMPLNFYDGIKHANRYVCATFWS